MSNPDIGVLLNEVCTMLRTFVVMTDEQTSAVALWVAHTHALAASDVTPYIHVASATPRTGKTRLLEVCAQLVPKPWMTARCSAAVLPRKVDAVGPTLLLDESDASFNCRDEYTEALRGILNSGYRRSGRTSVCVKQGAQIGSQDFSTFCPKMIAGIGTLPNTVADRCITIKLKRRRPDETVSRWRERDAAHAATPLRDALAVWGQSQSPALGAAGPVVLLDLHDRANEVWEPLLVIADAAGGSWPRLARAAAVHLSGCANESDPGIELLSDIADILATVATTDFGIATADLLGRLNGLIDRPWPTWSKGNEMTGAALANLLKPFDIVPAGVIQLRSHGPSKRGYRIDAFDDALSRYDIRKASKRRNISENGTSVAASTGNPEPGTNAPQSVNAAIDSESFNASTLCEPLGESPVATSSADTVPEVPNGERF